MKKLNFKQTMIDLMVKSMLNPSNESFYIGSLTLNRLNRIINGDSEMAEIIWTAYSRAEAEYLNDIAAYLGAEYQLGLTEIDTCPECGCRNYIKGCACPNCEYVEC